MADELLIRVQSLNSLTNTGVSHVVLSDLSWAAFHLGAARIGNVVVEQLVNSGMDNESIEQLYHEDRDHVEVAAMSLGFGDVKTALDLCADAVVNLSHTPTQPGWFFSIDDLNKTVVQGSRPSVQAWVTHLVGDPELGLLVFCRDSLIHRAPARLIQAGTPGAVAIRTSAGELTPPISELIPQFVSFGEHALETLCDAIASDYGTVPVAGDDPSA